MHMVGRDHNPLTSIESLCDTAIIGYNAVLEVVRNTATTDYLLSRDEGFGGVRASKQTIGVSVKRGCIKYTRYRSKINNRLVPHPRQTLWPKTIQAKNSTQISIYVPCSTFLSFLASFVRGKPCMMNGCSEGVEVGTTTGTITCGDTYIPILSPCLVQQKEHAKKQRERDISTTE